MSFQWTVWVNASAGEAIGLASACVACITCFRAWYLSQKIIEDIAMTNATPSNGKDNCSERRVKPWIRQKPALIRAENSQKRANYWPQLQVRQVQTAEMVRAPGTKRDRLYQHPASCL